MQIHCGEIYGKQTTNKLVMYHVIKVTKAGITLQNIDNPLSLLETNLQKIKALGYIRISQTPFINSNLSDTKKKKAAMKPIRCPYTLDFLEARADNERPAPILQDLFNQSF